MPDPTNPLAVRGLQPKAASQFESAREPLELVALPALMKFTSGSPAIRIGLIDGPVTEGHADLASDRIYPISGTSDSASARTDSNARMHGTFVAGILSARRGCVAPAICPNCSLLLRPIFGEAMATGGGVPSTTPQELGIAIIECVQAGSRVLNLSLALGQPSSKREKALEEALNYAGQHGVIVVAAAGNQGTIGSSAITRHPSVIPVVACDIVGRPLSASNLAGSIGRHGLSAPGDRITSLGHQGGTITLSGTSFAVPFVTGTIALLWSVFPTSTAAEVRSAVTQSHYGRRMSVSPPLLNASAAYKMIAMGQARGL
jgi:subtilisin family serine protease